MEKVDKYDDDQKNVVDFTQDYDSDEEGGKVRLKTGIDVR